LNSTDWTTHESQKVDIQTVNRNRLCGKHQNKWNGLGAVKVFAACSLGQRIQSPLPLSATEKDLSQWQKELLVFCEPLMQFIHFQVIIATTEQPNRRSPGVPSLFDALHLTNCPRPSPHNSTLVRCEAVSMCPHEWRLAGRGGSGRGVSIIGARPSSITRGSQAVTSVSAQT
jgi:hypothetical protein